MGILFNNLKLSSARKEGLRALVMTWISSPVFYNHGIMCSHVWQQLCVAAYQEKTDTSNIARHNVMLPLTLSCDPLSCD